MAMAHRQFCSEKPQGGYEKCYLYTEKQYHSLFQLHAFREGKCNFIKSSFIVLTNCKTLLRKGYFPGPFAWPGWCIHLKCQTK